MGLPEGEAPAQKLVKLSQENACAQALPNICFPVTCEYVNSMLGPEGGGAKPCLPGQTCQAPSQAAMPVAVCTLKEEAPNKIKNEPENPRETPCSK
jgi:hypothetical protein